MVDEEASYLYDLKIPERQKKRIEWKFTKLHMSELNWLLSSSQSNSELSNFDISLGKWERERQRERLKPLDNFGPA
jgi:hypothetical protein